MTPERSRVYDRLQSIVGNTPLRELKNILVPNGNRIFFKEEYRNPTGSHYDRVMVRLLRGLEEEGRIEPGRTPLIETSIGGSGASFAWVCRVLGYKCRIIIPADIPSSRMFQIESYSAEIILSPAGQGIPAMLARLGKYLELHKLDIYARNCDGAELYCTAGMADLAREIFADLDQRNIKRLNYFVSDFDDGLVVRSGQEFETHYNTRLIGVEPEISSAIAERWSQGGLIERFEELSVEESLLQIGVNPLAIDFMYPKSRSIVSELDDIIRVDRIECENIMSQLADLEGQHIGITSSTVLGGALELATKIHDQNILVLFSDPLWLDSSYTNSKISAKEFQRSAISDDLMAAFAKGIRLNGLC